MVADDRAVSAEWEPGGGLLIWLLLLVAPVGEAIETWHHDAWWAIALVVAYGAGFALIVYQFEHGVTTRIRYPILVTFVLAGLALTTVFNDTAVFVVVFTSMAVTVSLPLIRPAFLGLLVVTAAAMAVGIPGGVFAIIGLGFGTYIAGFVTFVMRRLFVTIAELQGARQELATAAVARERLRFARDLHDLLGHSLSVIVVKAELIRRTASRDPDAAAAAAADIESVGRRALAEVRDAVSGYRRADLRTEATRAEQALSDAGIATAVALATSAFDPESDAILAWAVREGATNVLRHSAAEHCTIEVTAAKDRIVLMIADDGAGMRAIDPEAADTTSGNGLRGLCERVTAAGGTVHAGPPHDPSDSPYGTAGFVLRVSVPAGQVAVADACGPGLRDAR